MLAPWKKSILKSRVVTLQMKVYIFKAMVFLVVMNECEHRTLKKAEHQRIHSFELWCWRRLLRVPWTARRSNQSILQEIKSGYSMEVPMLKLSSSTLTIWCKESTHWKRSWCWESLRAGRKEGNKGWDGWMASPTQWIWIWANSKR